jgi:O-antigen/teichoic acid export membrane protein
MQFAKSATLYFFTFFFNAAVSFFAFSITTHYLGEADLGIIYLYNSTTLLLVPFISIGAQFALSVDYFKMPLEKYRIHFSNGIMIPMISGAFFTILCVLLYYPLRSFIPINFFFAITLPLSCFLVVMNDIIIALIRNRGSHILFSGYSIAKNLLEISVTILLIAVVGMKWQGRLASGLITLIAAGFTSLILIRKWHLWSGNFQKSEVKKIARIGMPFIPERLAVFALAYSASFYINFYNGTKDVGLYGTGMQIAFVVNVSIVALMSLFHPFIFRNLANVPNLNNLRKAVFAFIGISLFITVALILGTPLLFKLFIGHKFQSGQVYARFLSIGFFFWSVYGVFIAFLLFIKKNRLIMYISLVGMCMSFGLNFYNVKHYGAIGATYTSMIVYFFMAVACMLTVNRFYSLKAIFFGKGNIVKNHEEVVTHH